MIRWLLTIAVVLSALAVLRGGSWWVWREWWSSQQVLYALMEERVDAALILRYCGARGDGEDENGITSLHYASGSMAHLLSTVVSDGRFLFL